MNEKLLSNKLRQNYELKIKSFLFASIKLSWMEKLMRQGKRFVLMGCSSVGEQKQGFLLAATVSRAGKEESWRR